MEKSRLGISPDGNQDSAATNQKANAPTNMIHYETFESSSENEDQKCIFESQALSYQNKDKVVSSKEKELKRIERLKRKERKLNEKLR